MDVNKLADKLKGLNPWSQMDWPETCRKAASLLQQQEAEIARLTEDRDHWKANHDQMVQRNAVLRERPDLPVDRLPAIARYEGQIRGLEDVLQEKRDCINSLRPLLHAAVERADVAERNRDAARENFLIMQQSAAKLAGDVERLTKERDEALEAEDEAKDSFWAVYPEYLEKGGKGISTEAARTALAERAHVAEDRVRTIQDALDRYDAALVRREHGGVAADRFLHAARSALQDGVKE